MLFDVQTDESLKRITEGLLNASKDIVYAIKNLKLHPSVCSEHLIKAKKAENFIDHCYREGLVELFKTNDVIRILKTREIYRHLSNAGDRAAEAANIISDILDVSAIESGKLNLSEENICPIETVHTSLRIVMRRAEDDGIQLIPEFDADLPMINADPRRLKQILINLLSNAIKFSHKGGAVSIKVNIGSAGGHVFTITDNGIGMSEDELEKAMSEFGQVDRHKSKKQEGTGLGIPLTKGLVELHGGTLTLTSIKGEGTIAKVVFPNSRVVGDSTTGN